MQPHHPEGSTRSAYNRLPFAKSSKGTANPSELWEFLTCAQPIVYAGCRSVRRTETSLEMPGSSMVTPNKESAIAIVRLLCVMTMN